jgi:hypothetical protein
MATEESVTITETAPDGTETTIEITTTKGDDSLVNEDGDSLVEEVIEALFDVEIGEDGNIEETDPESDEVAVENSDMTDYESELETDGVEFTEGDEMFDPTVSPTDDSETPFADTSSDPIFETTETTDSETPLDSETPNDEISADSVFPSPEPLEEDVSEKIEEEEAELADQREHIEAARDAQDAADEFVEAGDYEAASQAREVAENEAWEGGDNSVLHGSDSIDLETAADNQNEAEYYESQQAQHAQQGDYEAAREDADNAAYATQDADFQAGGSDHSGQAQAESDQMDWAVWEEGNADYYANEAEGYAAQGDFDNAQRYAEEAEGHQEQADHYGDLGEHGGEIGVYDPSSEVESGGSFDADPDTGYDSGIDSGIDSDFDSGGMDDY